MELAVGNEPYSWIQSQTGKASCERPTTTVHRSILVTALCGGLFAADVLAWEYFWNKRDSFGNRPRQKRENSPGMSKKAVRLLNPAGFERGQAFLARSKSFEVWFRYGMVKGSMASFGMRTEVPTLQTAGAQS
ncbi:hypothetical protein BJ508DRAFT_417510 [Ascobolus immersus RN42]|uniref:Uncharacterized protein n=1 Tax=Ascobolus immersus RN42 TaxID=1160509 RepID=A0A3N4HX92_ASCIM|nr:hypothetical protein BJ508DRAFT_417510 [Ascobolus immersus RN42]